MRFVIALTLFAVVFGAEVEVQPVVNPELVKPLITYINAESSFANDNPSQIALPKLSGADIPHDVGTLEFNAPKIKGIPDLPVPEERIQFIKSSSSLPSSHHEPVSTSFLDDPLKIIPLQTKLSMPAEYDTPISEGYRVDFVNLASPQIEPLRIAVPKSEVKKMFVPKEISYFVEYQDRMPKDIQLPFLYIQMPEIEPKIIDDPITQKNQNIPAAENVRGEFIDELLPKVTSINVGEPQQRSEVPDVNENRVQVFNVPLNQEHPVKVADLSRPGKIFPNPLWR